jgi:hypothetical protein
MRHYLKRKESNIYAKNNKVVICCKFDRHDGIIWRVPGSHRKSGLNPKNKDIVERHSLLLTYHTIVSLER